MFLRGTAFANSNIATDMLMLGMHTRSPGLLLCLAMERHLTTLEMMGTASLSAVVLFVAPLFCRVSSVFNSIEQANVRRTNVATKLKVTYLKDKFLDVCDSTLSATYQLTIYIG